MQNATALESVSASGNLAGSVHTRISSSLPKGRLDLDTDSVEHDLARLVLGIVEVVRQLIERQALRRVEGGRLTPEQIEKLGLTLMRLEERMDELKEHFAVGDKELGIDLGGLFEEIDAEFAGRSCLRRQPIRRKPGGLLPLRRHGRDYRLASNVRRVSGHRMQVQRAEEFGKPLEHHLDVSVRLTRKGYQSDAYARCDQADLDCRGASLIEHKVLKLRTHNIPPT